MRKYSKESLRKLDTSELIDLQFRISDKTRWVAPLNIVLCILSFIINILWIKWTILTITTLTTVYLIIMAIRYARAEKVYWEKWYKEEDQ